VAYKTPVTLDLSPSTAFEGEVVPYGTNLRGNPSLHYSGLIGEENTSPF